MTMVDDARPWQMTHDHGGRHTTMADDAQPWRTTLDCVSVNAQLVQLSTLMQMQNNYFQIHNTWGEHLVRALHPKSESPHRTTRTRQYKLCDLRSQHTGAQGERLVPTLCPTPHISGANATRTHNSPGSVCGCRSTPSHACGPSCCANDSNFIGTTKSCCERAER